MWVAKEILKPPQSVLTSDALDTHASQHKLENQSVIATSNNKQQSISCKSVKSHPTIISPQEESSLHVANHKLWIFVNLVILAYCQPWAYLTAEVIKLTSFLFPT